MGISLALLCQPVSLGTPMQHRCEIEFFPTWIPSCFAVSSAAVTRNWMTLLVGQPQSSHKVWFWLNVCFSSSWSLLLKIWCAHVIAMQFTALLYLRWREFETSQRRRRERDRLTDRHRSPQHGKINDITDGLFCQCRWVIEYLSRGITRFL